MSFIPGHCWLRGGMTFHCLHIGAEGKVIRNVHVIWLIDKSVLSIAI